MFCLQILLAFVLVVHAIPPLQDDRPRGILSKLGVENQEMKSTQISPRERLPITCLPTHYEIFSRIVLDQGDPDHEQFSASGSVTIHVTCQEASNVIVLHTNGPISSNFKIVVEGDEEELPNTIEYDTEKHFMIITFENNLVVGENYSISMDFTTEIRSNLDMTGLYYGFYDNPDSGVREYHATTQFEPTYARQWFPCFDEPHLKATFDLKLERMEKYNSIANTEIIATSEPVDGWITDTFATTPKMPTYLLAILVSNFKNSTDNDNFGKPVSTYAAPNFIDRGDGEYAAEHAAKIIKFFEDFYVEPYPISKMDSTALPHFSAGAMENWGLNHYREALLLYNKDESTEGNRYSITSVLAHELAHQWFGNLVTCRWWSHIWLNEGFATFLSYQGVKNVTPEFEAEKIIVNDASQNAMRFDATQRSHPMVMPETLLPHEIMAMFNTIAYDKGASIIRMMEGFLGERTLQLGLQKYLKAMEYDAALQDDLFYHLQLQANDDGVDLQDLTVKDIMDTWTLQKGFPLVRVSTAHTGDHVFISQERFEDYTRRSVRELNPNELWTIPISVATQDSPDFTIHSPSFWLKKNIALTTQTFNTSQWIILNKDATGYFRVLYDGPLNQLIVNQMAEDPSVISALTRSQILDDTFNCAWQRYTGIEKALALTVMLGKETEFVVWDTFFLTMRKAFTMFSNTGFHYLRDHYLNIIENALRAINHEEQDGEKGNILFLRSQLLDWACSMDSQICKDHANNLFDKWETNNEIIPINQQAVMYCAVVAAGGFDAHDFVYSKYVAQSHAAHKTRLLNALACSNEISLLNKMMEDALDDTIFPPAMVTTIIQRVAMNSIGRASTFRFIRSRITELHTFNPDIIPNVISTLAGYWNTQLELDDLLSCIETMRDILPENIINRLLTSVSAVEENIYWMEEFYAPMKTWFENN